MTFTIRIAVRDRPGALARIATALGKIGANIVELAVLERSVSTAVDQVVVEAPGSTADEVRAAVEGVEGAAVELLRPTRRSVGMPPLGLAVRLARVDADEVLDTLVDGLVLTFEATWSAVVASRDPQPLVRAASSGTPSMVNLATPWLPLRDVRRIPEGPWTPERWTRAGEPLELAAAPLGTADEAVVVCRPYGPRFAQRELADLGMLAELAVARADTAAATA